MIIDAHAHLVAPPSFYAHRGNLQVARGQYGIYHAKIPDAELEKSAAQNVQIMDGVGTDIQVLSPRPFMMLHGENRWDDIVSWAQDNNDMIARTIKLHPKRFRGVGGLPQATGVPVEKMFDEIKRCINDLGFLGVLINPDPSEGPASRRRWAIPIGIPYTNSSASTISLVTSTAAPAAAAKRMTSTSSRKRALPSPRSPGPTCSSAFPA